MYTPPLIRSWTKKMAGAKAETIAILRLFVRAAGATRRDFVRGYEKDLETSFSSCGRTAASCEIS